MPRIELCDRITCTGCAACSNKCPKKAISMVPDKEGFLNPQINRDLCVECGLCQKCCPIINYKNNVDTPIAVYAGYINNKKIRKHSSSGGAFPAFAEFFYSLYNGTVVAAAFDDHLNLKHVVSTKESDLRKFQGSKYVQSDVGRVYIVILKFLTNGSNVLFVGTPCQVAGLKAFLGKDYDNLVMVDLVCHGVPSPLLFHTYLKQVGIKTTKKYKDFYFRSQKQSSIFSHSVISKLGFKRFISPLRHSYICAYLKGWLHRESCYRCPFAAMPRQGDCTIADFWGVLANKVPFNGDANDGVSMIMINTKKGERVFEKIKGFFYLEKKSIEDAKIDNHNLYTHDIRPEIRDTIYQEFIEKTPRALMDKYKLKLPMPPSLYTRAKGKLKRILRIK